MESKIILIIILNIFIVLIALYIFFLYIKDKTFHTYPCYNMMSISLILLIDNIIRVIPTDNAPEGIKYIQAYILVLFDKILLNTLTIQAIIYYLGIIKTKYYYDHQKCVFLTTLIINLIISLTISSIYITNGIVDYGIYYYCKDGDIKKYTEIYFIAVSLGINAFFIIVLLVYVSNQQRKASKGIIEDLGYCHHFIRILLMFFVNVLTFIEQYLIIFDILGDADIDLLYLSTCLIIDFYYTLNKTVYDETLKIFCIKKYEKKVKKEPIKMNDISRTDEDDDDDIAPKRTESWDED